MIARTFCFTLNNYTEEEEKKIIDSDYRYLIIGHEIGEQKTPHLQGYIEFSKPKRINGLKTISERAHWEQRLGTREQARDYCRKDNDWKEYGDWEAGGHGTRTDISQAIQTIKKHTKLTTALDENPDIARWLRLFTMLRSQLDKDEAPEWRDMTVEVYWGPTGTGKTRKAKEEAHGDYFIMDQANNVWFDGYCRNKTLILDDFYGWLSYSHLLRILDGHPLRLEVKGGFTYAYYTHVVITSNKHWTEWYPTVKDQSALERRLTRVLNFGPPKFDNNYLTK